MTSDTLVITVNALPTVTASGGTICKGMSTIITASGANTYLWSNGIGTGSSKTVNPTLTTIYSITGTDLNNCSNTTNATVILTPFANNHRQWRKYL